MRAVIAAGAMLVISGLLASPSDSKQTPGKIDKVQKGKKVLPKVGIKTSGVQIPMEGLKALAEVPVVGTPGALVIGDAIWAINQPKDALVRIDAKTNKALEPVSGLHKPCSGLAIGFGSVWISNCGDRTISRVDLKTAKVTATLSIGATEVRNAIAINGDSAWILTDNKTTLSRVDPVSNLVVSELRIAEGCDDILFAETALWVTCPALGAGQSKVLRIDPKTNLVVNRIDVSSKPRSLAAGENGIWVLCQAEGKIEKIDPKTNKVVTTVDLGVPNAEGSIAFGEGFLWASLPGFPISRIDLQTNKVVQQFTGEGGGLLYLGLGSVWYPNVAQNSIWRIDPKRIIATLAE